MPLFFMFRKFNFIIDNQEFYEYPVVYIITIGDMYYLGTTQLYKKRAYQHRRNFSKMVFSKRLDLGLDYYKRIYEYLFDNPSIIDIRIEVLEVCDSAESAKTIEDDWLTYLAHFGMADIFLNVGYGMMGDWSKFLTCSYAPGMGLYCL